MGEHVPRSPPVLHAYEAMHAYWHAHIYVNPLLKILATGLAIVMYFAVSCFSHMQISMLPLPKKHSNFIFELGRCNSSLLAFGVSVFLYVHPNLFCNNNLIQQQGQAECTMHGLYCYKQHDNHTNNLWMKILCIGMMIILF